jgi:hypothetical protein
VGPHSITSSARARNVGGIVKPSVFGAKDNVLAGGLISYAPDLNDLTRRAATYIDKILKGSNVEIMVTAAK